MNWLPTALSTVACALAAFYALRARVDGLKVGYALQRLDGALARLIGHDDAIQSLDSSLRKLQGKYHAHVRDFHQTEPEVLEATTRQTRAAPLPPGFVEVCGNWAAAAVGGPLSEAASCECEYCVWKRSERAAMRAAHVPKGQGARIDAIRRGQES